MRTRTSIFIFYANTHMDPMKMNLLHTHTRKEKPPSRFCSSSFSPPFWTPPLTFISGVFVFCVYTYAYNVTEECLCYQETSSFEYFLAVLNAAFVIYTTSHVVIKKKKKGINFYENVLFFRYHVLLMIQFIWIYNLFTWIYAHNIW